MTTTPTTKEEREKLQQLADARSDTYPSRGYLYDQMKRLIADVDRPRVYVNSPARNIGDPRPVRGFYPLIREYPNHACGPCMEIADEYGVTTVGRDQCWTGDDIENLRSTVDRLTREVEEARKTIANLQADQSSLSASMLVAHDERREALTARDAAQAKLGEVERALASANRSIVTLREQRNREADTVDAMSTKLATLEAKGGEGLSLAVLRAANVARATKWDNGAKPPLTFALTELAGEVGEACNAGKKLARAEMGMVGGTTDTGNLAEELADVVICADLVAWRAGIDLGSAVAAKFNATSAKHGFEERIAAGRASAGQGDEAIVPHPTPKRYYSNHEHLDASSPEGDPCGCKSCLTLPELENPACFREVPIPTPVEKCGRCGDSRRVWCPNCTGFDAHMIGCPDCTCPTCREPRGSTTPRALVCSNGFHKEPPCQPTPPSSSGSPSSSSPERSSSDASPASGPASSAGGGGDDSPSATSAAGVTLPSDLAALRERMGREVEYVVDALAREGHPSVLFSRWTALSDLLTRQVEAMRACVEALGHSAEAQESLIAMLNNPYNVTPRGFAASAMAEQCRKYAAEARTALDLARPLVGDTTPP